MNINLLKKSILVILIVVGIYGIVNNLVIYSDRRNTQYSANVSLATPMSDLPLKITEEFGLYQDSDGVYYYGGTIYNNGSEAIKIDYLSYTFKYGLTTYYQPIIETNIYVLPKETYTLHYAPLFVVYGDEYVVDYSYVKITVSGQEQYLYHENSQLVINEYNKVLRKDKKDFEKFINQPLKNSIGFSVFTLIVFVFLIKSFIVKD